MGQAEELYRDDHLKGERHSDDQRLKDRVGCARRNTSGIAVTTSGPRLVERSVTVEDEQRPINKRNSRGEGEGEHSSRRKVNVSRANGGNIVREFASIGEESRYSTESPISKEQEDDKDERW